MPRHALLWLKRLLPHGLLGRSLMIVFTPLVLVQVVSTYVFYTSHWENVAKRLAFGLAGDIGGVIDALQSFPSDEDRHRLFTIAADRMDLSMWFVENGALPPAPRRHPSSIMQRALVDALDQRVHRPYRVSYNTHAKSISVSVQLAGGVLEVVVPDNRLVSYTTYVFILWMVGSSMLLLAIATVFMRNQVRSVRRLAQAADRFGRGVDVAGFKPEGATEVRQAGLAFNLMRERILRQIQQRTEMLAGVSHDLRTPLTRMKLQLAMMGNAEGCAELAQDVAEMERMVEGYLAFARGEGGERAQRGDLAALVEEVVGRFRRQGDDVDFDCDGALPMALRMDAMARAIANLVGNAARYAKRVQVRVERRPEAAEVLVDDDGPGIPAERREEVFRPFTRLESSRNSETGGVGLGLAIARDIVRGQGGEITLEDSPLGGLRARVRLPL